MTGPVAGLVLAGGRSRRMGGRDKALIDVGGRPLLERVIERARPQVAALVLNANGDPRRFAAHGLPLVADAIGGHAGPLAGILAGLEWLRDNRPGMTWMASFAADTPLLPADLVTRLEAAVRAEGADIACAESGGEIHPVFALWPVRLAGDLRRALVDEDVRGVGRWMHRHRVARAVWPAGENDPFFNVNTPDDVERLGRMLAGRGSGHGV
ncbi:MAG: molybdenum cofactor guanylyltransferase MobA [Magnetospirillum sp.]|nr:molybdenum cofactor guanylyltransferase MobA [Magnetospirillum sp.]